nr:DNA cytosine methyltransferase [Brevibacillus laterosporus]
MGSLFSGAGIMDLVFKQAGFDIVFALEENTDAVKTYRYNHGDHVVHAWDYRWFFLCRTLF